ncbi:hypothetical protein MARPU_11960 [Marichromatium purpuratum 984]|uniref:Uncharacterized protein n=1 Tax=Marichromatium purpuratum 984 TaxID=765910 RepID=W0E8K2_MARPU|nr:hypothetical protein MARPU_11960 [Marichromatium purpuratum 984]
MAVKFRILSLSVVIFARVADTGQAHAPVTRSSALA